MTVYKCLKTEISFFFHASTDLVSPGLWFAQESVPPLPLFSYAVLSLFSSARSVHLVLALHADSRTTMLIILLITYASIRNDASTLTNSSLVLFVPTLRYLVDTELILHCNLGTTFFWEGSRMHDTFPVNHKSELGLGLGFE